MLFRIVSVASFLGLLSMSVFIPEQYTLMAFMFWPATVLMLIFIALNPGGLLSTPLLQRLGQISFPFYMIHQLVIRYISLLSDKADLNLSLPISVSVSLVLSMLLAHLSGKYILKK